MFIVWGKTLRKKKLGYTAEFCPYCQELRPFLVSQLFRRQRLYFTIPFGSKEEAGAHGQCQRCKGEKMISEPRGPFVDQTPAPQDWARMRGQTPANNPYLERWQLQKTLKSKGPDYLSSDQRAQLAMDLFGEAAMGVELSYGAEKDRTMQMLIGGAFVGLFGLLGLIGEEDLSMRIFAMLSLLGAGMLFFFSGVRNSTRRANLHLSLLRGELSRLRLSREDLKAIWKALSAEELIFARVLSWRKAFKAISGGPGQ